MTALRALARYARARPSRDHAACELCAAPLADAHAHVVDLVRRSLACACRACAILFTDPAAGARFRTVPDRVRFDPALTIDDATWAPLGVPVGLAFFFFASALDRWVACYPSPAGATEAELDDGALARLEPRALLDAMEPDVEALLLRRPRGGGVSEAFLVPIDACYELVGAVRARWRGFDGGDEAHEAIDAFFERMRARARPIEAGGRR